jgi:hypothetical protein
VWVQPDAADPLRNQSGVLPRCHAASGPAPCEGEIAGFLWCGSQIIIDSLPCGFCELEPHRSARLPLSYSCSIDRIPAGRNVLELQRDNVALVARAVPLAGPTSATASGGCERRSKHSRSPTIDHPLTSLGPRCAIAIRSIESFCRGKIWLKSWPRSHDHSGHRRSAVGRVPPCYLSREYLRARSRAARARHTAARPWYIVPWFFSAI